MSKNQFPHGSPHPAAGAVEMIAHRIYNEVCSDSYLEKAGMTQNVAAISKIISDLPSPSGDEVLRDALKEIADQPTYNGGEYISSIAQDRAIKALTKAEAHLSGK